MIATVNSWSERNRAWVLTAAVVLGFVFRLYGLRQVGLAEDEVRKLEAVQAYSRGDLTANAEHPVLMKAFVWLSVEAAAAYNRRLAPSLGWAEVGPEVSVRLPNVVFGALTAIALYLVGSAFFSTRVGLLAAIFWAGGINAIVINRIAKEDTLMVFFILLGFYFHRRMKLTSDEEAGRKRTFYLLSAAAFGLMLASKYFPHYIGLNALYFLLHRKVQPAGYPPDRYGLKELSIYLALLLAVFLLFNPMILHPAVISHILSYTGHEQVVHNGDDMHGPLYFNSVLKTPTGGTPWYFYLLFLAVKVPLTVLLTSAAGLYLCLRRWRDPGPYLVLFWLVFWLVPYSFFGVKFLRYTLSLLPALYLAAAYGLSCALEAVTAISREIRPSLRYGLVAVGTHLLAVLPAAALFWAAPFFSLYVNPLGGGMIKAGHFFPHDEYYDVQLREMLAQSLRLASQGDVLAGETPSVFRYYLERAGRGDVRVVNLSDPEFDLAGAGRVFVFLQPGRRYFENREFFEALWDRRPPVAEGDLSGSPAVRVYTLEAERFLEIARRRAFIETVDRQRG